MISTHLEPNESRLALRWKIPLDVRIEGGIHRAQDWSLRGFSLRTAVLRESMQQDIDCEWLIPNEGGPLAVTCTAKVVRHSADGTLGFAVRVLSPQAHEPLQRYVLQAQPANLHDDTLRPRAATPCGLALAPHLCVGTTSTQRTPWARHALSASMYLCAGLVLITQLIDLLQSFVPPQLPAPPASVHTVTQQRAGETAQPGRIL
nr:PilZ domain-containing protein [uncultured Rhodoferax sp.]